MKRVAVFGAGIAGLTAAHELVKCGHHISVYESAPEAGGFFRSERLEEYAGMPSEYSWHGFGPWYHNTFDILKQIPFDQSGSIYDRGLSRPIDFGIVTDEGGAEFYKSFRTSVQKMFRMSSSDKLSWEWLLVKTWIANRRSEERYSRQNASEEWGRVMSDIAWKTWRSCFGPWIGSDWSNVSLHQAGEFFRKQLMTSLHHDRGAGESMPASTNGTDHGWLLLRGPSSECWFERWVQHLRELGVQFHWNQSLYKLEFDGASVSEAVLDSGRKIQADAYILAINPFAAADILERTPKLAQKDELALFRPLVQDGPHIQVSFRIAFGEKIKWPGERTAVVIADSEFNLTLFAQEQAWMPNVNLGDGIKSLWTGTACVAVAPGRLFGKPLKYCTREEFTKEVLAQLSDCQGLNYLIRSANGGRDWKSFPIVRVEVWHEWSFSPEGIESAQPKWVNTTNTQPYMPRQITSVPNLLVAGAHTKTSADVWSIEAAVESGRRAARGIDQNVPLIPQHKPIWLRTLNGVDDFCFSMGAPHILDLSIVLLIIVVLGAFVTALSQ